MSLRATAHRQMIAKLETRFPGAKIWPRLVPDESVSKSPLNIMVLWLSQKNEVEVSGYKVLHRFNVRIIRRVLDRENAEEFNETIDAVEKAFEFLHSEQASTGNGWVQLDLEGVDFGVGGDGNLDIAEMRYSLISIYERGTP